jgi:hypothetical protein
MCPESQIGYRVGRYPLSLWISIMRNLSIADLFAVCRATQLSPATNPVPLYINVDGAYCLQYHEVNSEVGFKGNPFIGCRNLKA